MAEDMSFVFAVLCMIGVVSAATSQEALLRAAILNRSIRNLTLTENIVLKADLPILPEGKIFALTGKLSGTSRPVTIDGRGRYKMFTNVGTADYKTGALSLTLNNLVLTRANWSAVHLGASVTRLVANNVTFSNMPSALEAGGSMQAIMTGCKFLRNTNGAVQLQWGPRATFKNCEFTSNTSPHEWGGGAILGTEVTSVVVENSRFTNNSATAGSGGAISVLSEGSGMSTSNATIRNSIFLNNVAPAAGAVRLFQGNLIVVGTIFRNNTATKAGGGAIFLYAFEGPGCFASIARSRFEKNKAPTSFGGAFALWYLTEVVFCSSSFLENTGRSGSPSNGYVRRFYNKITTTPKATIPHVQVDRNSDVQYGTGKKCLG